jgi:hypothetical protein
MLNPEINRFLGNALLDPELLKCLFNGDRAVALKGFNLRPEERARILGSCAHNLAELSRELLATFATPDLADADTEAARFTHAFQARNTAAGATHAHTHALVQRALNALPPPSRNIDALRSKEDFVALMTAS